MKNRIKIFIGDITTLQVDAIVNAANRTLLGGGGVDGAIHRSAGPELLKECRLLNGCNTGEAKITKGYKLPAKFVIHTVGPVWSGGNNNESELLVNCYRNSLMLASQKNFKDVAFPAISTGVYRYPLIDATRIAINETFLFLKHNKHPETVIFVCFNNQAESTYIEILDELLGNI
ncbi:MAG TPA: O-acetyl-ADP-ribose deacetylase [Bacteroidales bacterium]|nr:O-acetyl-ADP-ribose deacetylase [Bacteroidales bacterium]